MRKQCNDYFSYIIAALLDFNQWYLRTDWIMDWNSYIVPFSIFKRI